MSDAHEAWVDRCARWEALYNEKCAAMDAVFDQNNAYYAEIQRLRVRAGIADRLAEAPESLARAFHEAYERLAPAFGYETRRDSAVAWENVPEPNKSLMIAVAKSVAAWAASGASEQADK